MLSGSYILVSINDGLDYETALQLASASDTSQVKIQNVESVSLGTEVASRYTMIDGANSDRKIETAYIPIPWDLSRSRGDKLKGVTIRTIRDEAFDERTFDQVLESFKFIK
jgi:hypothetical protein